MDLQGIDWLILAMCAFAASGGFRLGFVARAMSWAGMGLGFGLAVLLLPAVLRSAQELSSTSKLGVVILMMLAGALLGQMAGLFAGSKVINVLPNTSRVLLVDRVAGAGAGVIGVLVMLWLMLPTAANLPGWTAQAARNSVIARAIYDHAPDPPDTMQTLRRLIGDSNFPAVFDSLQATPDNGPAPSSVSLSTAVVDAVRASTVKVEGDACRKTQEGSGFAVGDGLIATNAHVVAGERKTRVLTPSGDAYSANVVLYDAARDLALLRVPRYVAPPLPIASAATVGETGAVFGHPGGQDALNIQPATVSRQIIAVGRDLYDRQQTKRDVLVLASQLHPGDSGGALVNVQGKVIGVAFAVAPDRANTSYALSTSELRAVLARSHDQTVSTGDCVTD